MIHATKFTIHLHISISSSYFLSSLLILLDKKEQVCHDVIFENLLMAVMYAEARAVMMIASRASPVPTRA